MCNHYDEAQIGYIKRFFTDLAFYSYREVGTPPGCIVPITARQLEILFIFTSGVWKAYEEPPTTSVYPLLPSNVLKGYLIPIMGF